MKNKKVVVTGGMGFIGSHLTEKLLEDNEVTIIDNGSTGRIQNIAHLLDHNNLTFIRGSIVDLNLSKIFKGKDYVFHLAALSCAPKNLNCYSTFNEVNITGTLKVLVAAKDTRIKKVIFSSSSSVYGDTTFYVKNEDMPVNPQSPYAITKATGEMYCQIFQDRYGLPTVCLRYFNVFGPRQNCRSHYSYVIPEFITSILNDERPVIFGDGEQSRDFSYIKHVVNANILSCESDIKGVFNVACGRRITMNELVAYINGILGKDIIPKYVDSRPEDVRHLKADISKLRYIGYDPKGDFRDELAEVVKWFSDQNL